MHNLQVREVPAAVYGALAANAKREHRSLSRQTLITLEQGLGQGVEPTKRRRRVLQEIEEARLPDIALPDAVDVLREDRRR